MNNDAKDFTALKVWQKAHSLSLDIYKLAKLLPLEEKYRLADQIIRSARSISANIAEGFGRYYYQDNAAFCRKARGSLEETRNHLMNVIDNELLKNCDDAKKYLSEYEEVRKMLNVYIKYLLEKRPGKND